MAALQMPLFSALSSHDLQTTVRESRAYITAKLGPIDNHDIWNYPEIDPDGSCHPERCLVFVNSKLISPTVSMYVSAESGTPYSEPLVSFLSRQSHFSESKIKRLLVMGMPGCGPYTSFPEHYLFLSSLPSAHLISPTDKHVSIALLWVTIIIQGFDARHSRTITKIFQSCPMGESLVEYFESYTDRLEDTDDYDVNFRYNSRDVSPFDSPFSLDIKPYSRVSIEAEIALSPKRL
jgi:hypothetical protein